MKLPLPSLTLTDHLRFRRLPNRKERGFRVRDTLAKIAVTLASSAYTDIGTFNHGEVLNGAAWGGDSYRIVERVFLHMIK